MSVLPRCICDPFKAIVGDYDQRCSRHAGVKRSGLLPPKPTPENMKRAQRGEFGFANDEFDGEDSGPHCLTAEVPLSADQRKLLTVTREVSIPGAVSDQDHALTVAYLNGRSDEKSASRQGRYWQALNWIANIEDRFGLEKAREIARAAMAPDNQEMGDGEHP